MTQHMTNSTHSSNTSAAADLGHLADYSPQSLPAAAWTQWRSSVCSLVAAAHPANKTVATIWAGALCEVISLDKPDPGSPLAEVLSESAISTVAEARRSRGRSEVFAEDGRRHLKRLQRVARGFPFSRSASGPSRPRTPQSPGMEALRELARSTDASAADAAQQLLADLVAVKPLPWANPLTGHQWRKFLQFANSQGMLIEYRWTDLRRERLSEELFAVRPAIETLSDLNHCVARLDALSRSAPLYVQESDIVLRGSATVEQSHSWIIKDAEVSQLSRTPHSRRSTNKRRKVSKAEMRRLAAAFAEPLDTEPEPLSNELEAILASWRPGNQDNDKWEAARELSLAIMRRSHIRGKESLRKHLRLVAGLVMWAQRSGYPERIEDILTGEAIDEYLGSLTNLRTNKSLSTARADLRRVASHINSENGGPVPAVPLPQTDARPPYTDEDVYWILRRVGNVSNPRIRRSIQTAVALGLGAGLMTQDLAHLTRSDVEDLNDEGILVSVRGPKPRKVWLRRRYEPLLRAGIKNLTRNEAILGRNSHKDTVGDLYETIQPVGDGPRVLQGRLRNTWIATLMMEPIPIQTILQAAGLEGARTLADLARHLHPTSDLSIVRGAA